MVQDHYALGQSPLRANESEPQASSEAKPRPRPGVVEQKIKRKTTIEADFYLFELLFCVFFFNIE
jgi:hypothetical protein